METRTLLPPPPPLRTLLCMQTSIPDLPVSSFYYLVPILVPKFQHLTACEFRPFQFDTWIGIYPNQNPTPSSVLFSTRLPNVTVDKTFKDKHG